MPVTDKQTILWIKEVLTNDEVSDDTELVEFFVEEGIEKADAKVWVSRRCEFLNKLNFV